jgi:hypothetical protein
MILLSLQLGLYQPWGWLVFGTNLSPQTSVPSLLFPELIEEIRRAERYGDQGRSLTGSSA